MHFRRLVSWREVAKLLNLSAEIVRDKAESVDNYRAKRGFESGPHLDQRNTYALGSIPTADTTPTGVAISQKSCARQDSTL